MMTRTAVITLTYNPKTTPFPKLDAQLTDRLVNMDDLDFEIDQIVDPYLCQNCGTETTGRASYCSPCLMKAVAL